MLTLGIVIVNWNAGEPLTECLRSIFMATQTCFRLSGVVVVDNGSALRPLSSSILETPQLTVLRNSVNRGFAAACNQGAACLCTDFLLFLNPDASVKPDTLDKAISLLEPLDNAKIAVCGVSMIDPFGRPSFCGARFPTPQFFLREMLGLNKLLGRLVTPRLFTSKDLTGSQFIDQVIGAFFLVRSRVFEELRGFDERFFVYFEEVDFSLRVRDAGYLSYHLAEAEAVHIGGGCSEQDIASRLFYSVRSRLVYARKHFAPLPRGILFLATLIIEPLTRILKCVCSGSWQTLQDTVRAYHRLFVAIFRGTLYGLYR
jgi:N-acetylglucosaminyl-diphospho-decaprenol L-rhamnosyltransferase